MLDGGWWRGDGVGPGYSEPATSEVSMFSLAGYHHYRGINFTDGIEKLFSLHYFHYLELS